MELLDGVDLRPAASPHTIAAVQAEMGVRFPAEYEQFLRHADGGVGLNGSLLLYSVTGLAELNEDWTKWHPGQVLFGSDGGMEGYSFELGPSRMVVREVPFDSIDPEDEPEYASSFSEFLEKVHRDYRAC